MALSLEAIFQPLKEFFLNQFALDPASPVQFRFDKFGSTVSEEDFLADKNQPGLGYSPAAAIEFFSDLVNQIPVDTSDGMNVYLSPDAPIDQAYHDRLLAPAIPYLPQGLDDATKQAMIQDFDAVKAEAVKVWSEVQLAPLAPGVMANYKPSFATPVDWGDTSKDDAWTSHSFEVNDTGPPPPAGGASNLLWKLMPSDDVMTHILQLPQTENTAPPPVNITSRLFELQAAPRAILAQNQTATDAEPLAAAPLRPALALPAIAIAGAAIGNLNLAPVAAGDTHLYQAYRQQYGALDIATRIHLDQYLDTSAPTQPVQTNNMSISFDYCLVTIRRPWYVDSFINDTSWCIPGMPKGKVTSGGGPGTWALLPTRFVAVRNLEIEADWTPDDVQSASQAISFGPFKVDHDIANRKLSHAGIQIIGWVVQDLPALPPNDPPDGVQS